MRRIITAMVIMASTLIASPAHAGDTVKVKYCESYRDNGRTVTFIETDVIDFEVIGMTMRNTPIRGQRALIESPVVKGPVIVHCMVRIVNGRRVAVLSTRGGAEWVILSPRIIR